MNEKLINILKELDIEYKYYEHDNILTVSDADSLDLVLPGLNLKNLLIKDKKSNNFYLVILDDHRRFDYKDYCNEIKWSKVRFATSEELFELLKLTPGSVGPFGFINDIDNKVKVVISKEITNANEDELVNFPFNKSNVTIGITKKDFLKFLKFLNKEIIFEK